MRSTSLSTVWILALFLGAVSLTCAQPLPAEVRQLVVVRPADWDTHRGSMQFYEVRGRQWTPVLKAEIPVLLGRAGTAWGRGLVPTTLPKGARIKLEGDKRTPAGVFAIGRAFGYAPKAPKGSSTAYRQITQWDCWIEDVNNPLYNRHVIVDPKRIPPWFSKAQMRMNDEAHSLKLEIRHNADPPVPGFGSAIFFHIRRGVDRPTAGCTTMREEDLRKLIAWINPKLKPHLVHLPQAEYARRRIEWGLP